MAALHEMPMIVDMIRQFSQEEGLKDHEIAQRMNLCRETVARIRTVHGIPKVNLKKRKDKTYHCIGCNKDHVIRREERKPVYCPECLYRINNNMPLITKNDKVTV